MITNDYKNIIRQMLSSGGTAQGLLPIKDVGGTTRYLAGYTAYPYTVSTTFTTTAANAGVSVGTGTTASTENDYQLESTVTSDLTGTVSVSKNVDANGNAYVVLDVTLTNGGSDDISISEIGYKQELSASTTQSGTTTDDYVFLIDRTVLSSPIVVEAGQQGIIRYSLLTRTNLANSVEDVQVDGVSILDANNIAQLDSSDFGTTVVANPSDTATGTLTKIQIDDTVYTVQDSGSGSVTVFGTDETPTTVYTSEETPIVISVSGFTRTANNIIMVRLGKLSTISYTPLISEYTAGLYFNVNSLGAIPVYYNNTKVISDSVFTFDTQAIYVLLLRNVALQQESWRFDIIGISNSSGGNNVSYGTSNPSGGNDGDIYLQLNREPTVLPTSWRYMKFEIDAVRGTALTQLSGLRFYNKSGTVMTYPSFTYTCNVGNARGDQTPYQLLTGGKYCSNGNTRPVVIVYDFATNLDLATYNYYRWSTAADFAERDPITWKLYFSNDGENFTLFDSVENYPVTTERSTIAYEKKFLLDPPSVVNVWVNTNGTWRSDYFPTLDNVVSNIELTNTATFDYAVGEYFFKQGTLYRVTSAITAGSAFIVNTNIVPVNIMDELTASIIVGTIPINRGGTGNTAGYIRTGQKANTTIGTNATAEGYQTTASGNYSHAEGSSTTASGNSSHAEGSSTQATASSAHAEGNGSKATGSAAHAENTSNTASGSNSHAGGNNSTSMGAYSFVHGRDISIGTNGQYAAGFGQGTVANYSHQFVTGKYNNNKSTNIFEVGNGTGTLARSNALELDASGNLKTAGTITDSSGSPLSPSTAIAPVENDSTASQAYAIGDYFMRNGKFCTATAVISSGSALTLNTNYTEGDVASSIANLVVANPVGTATDDLEKVQIGNTIYDIPGGSSGGRQYTCDLLFENDPLPTPESGTANTTRTYTLSKSINDYDAVMVTSYGQHGSQAELSEGGTILILKSDYNIGTANEYDKEINASLGNDAKILAFSFPDDTTIKTHGGRNTYGNEPILHKVYGLKFNSSIFSPEIYSEEEREIGVFLDGKPLYQKTIYVEHLYTTNDGVNLIEADSSYIDQLVDAYGSGYSSQYQQLTTIGSSHKSASAYSTRILLRKDLTPHQLAVEVGTNYALDDAYVTIKYTKVSDTPGSAHWLPGGTIAVNYDTSEQIVGQWMGQTLYQKTFENLGVSLSANTWTNVGISITNIDAWEVIFNKSNTQGYDNQYPMLYRIYNGEFQAFCQFAIPLDELTLQYTKTTDTPGSANPTILATQAELEAMADHFQDGVDAVYDACVSKGSTPATHSLADVVDAIDNISGGGSTYAFLEFTYNQGTTVTATNSSTTLTSDTSGDYIFAIPNSGTWTFTSGGNSVSILVNEYGSRLNGRFTLLPYSILTNILAEATVDDYVAGATNWDAFTIGGTATITTDTSRTVLNLPQDAYAKYDLVDVNTPVTVYLISKEISGDQYGRIIEIPYARSDRNCPMFIAMNSGDVYYSTWGGSNEQATGVDPKSNYHVYAISLDMTNKYAHYCIDGNTCTTMPFNNSGNSVWLTEEHTFANDSGTNSNVLFAAVVDGNESDSVMQQNCSSLMTYFNIV